MKRRVRVHEVEFPKEWSTSEPVLVSPLATEKVGRRGEALLVVVLFGDGTNIVALTWPGGQALARTSFETGWSIEERFDGEKSPGEAGGVVERMWRMAVDALVGAVRDAEDYFGGRPS